MFFSFWSLGIVSVYRVLWEWQGRGCDEDIGGGVLESGAVLFRCPWPCVQLGGVVISRSLCLFLLVPWRCVPLQDVVGVAGCGRHEDVGGMYWSPG